MSARIGNIESACYFLGGLLLIGVYAAYTNGSSTSVDGIITVSNYPYRYLVAPLIVSGIILFAIGIFIHLRYRKSAS